MHTSQRAPNRSTQVYLDLEPGLQGSAIDLGAGVGFLAAPRNLLLFWFEGLGFRV